MEYKEDLRIVRTRKLLSNTLLDIMEETSIEKISVIDLCNRAMVNRATFYAHFEDKYHLLNFALDELQDEVYAKFTHDFAATTPSDMLKAVMLMAIDFLFDKKNDVAKVIFYNRNEKVISTIQDSLAQSIKYQLSKFKDSFDIKIPIHILSAFFAGGMVSIALLMLDNPEKCSYQELVSYADTVSKEMEFKRKNV
jgi:AcrR family transcriptional regulator